MSAEDTAGCPITELATLVKALHTGDTPAALFGFQRLVVMIERLGEERDTAIETLAVRAVAQERIDSEAAIVLNTMAAEMDGLRKELSMLRRARAH